MTYRCIELLPDAIGTQVYEGLEGLQVLDVDERVQVSIDAVPSV